MITLMSETQERRRRMFGKAMSEINNTARDIHYLIDVSTFGMPKGDFKRSLGPSQDTRNPHPPRRRQGDVQL